jgi:hypothetical protein
MQGKLLAFNIPSPMMLGKASDLCSALPGSDIWSALPGSDLVIQIYPGHLNRPPELLAIM